MHKERRKYYIKEYIGFCLFYLIVFAIMLNRHYSIDAFAYSRNSTNAYVGNLNLGRFGNYVVFGLFRNINIVTHQRIFTYILIITLSIVSCTLYIHLKKHIHNLKYDIILKTSVIIVFCNVFMIDFFVYIEMVLAWCFGIVLVMLALLQIDRNMTIKNWLLMFLFMLMSVSFYQALIGFFVYFALIDIYILNEGKLTKSAFWNSAGVLLCGGGAGIFNIGLLRVLQKIGIAQAESRTEDRGLQGILSNIKEICGNIKNLFFNTHGFMPAYMVLIALIIMYGMIIVTLIYRREAWQQYIYIFLLIVCVRGVVYVPHLLASTVWMAPRSIISYWSIFSMPCIILLVWNVDKLSLCIEGILAVIVMGTNIVNIQMVSENVIATNRLDEQVAYMIQQKIDLYEEKSGQIVDTIYIRNDDNPSYKYKAIDFQQFELCERIYNVSWGCVEAINYYNNKEYITVLMDDASFANRFSKKDWDSLNLDEQMVFDGNSLYFVAY